MMSQSYIVDLYRKCLQVLQKSKPVEKEGVKIAFLNNIKDILKDENGNVCGVQVAKMELGEMDESGRASCYEVKDSLFTMDCDLVAMAIGQKVDFTPLNDDLKNNQYTRLYIKECIHYWRCLHWAKNNW